jgi:hypothetical protein
MQRVAVGARVAYIEHETDDSSIVINQLVGFPLDLDGAFWMTRVAGKAGEPPVTGDAIAETEGRFVGFLKGMASSGTVWVIWGIAGSKAGRRWGIHRDLFAKGAGARRAS